MKKLSIAMFTLFVVLSTATVARAVPPILREGTHGMWGAAAMGPLVGVRNAKFSSGGFTGEAEPPDQFGFFLTFGYHFSGNCNGPAVAIDLQPAFGDDATTFGIVPKFVWDIRIIPGLGLYLSPMAGLGYALYVPDCPSGADCDNWAGLTLQFGFEGKLIIGDRGMVFFRPMHLEFDIMHAPEPLDDFGTFVRYGLMFGGGAIF